MFSRTMSNIGEWESNDILIKSNCYYIMGSSSTMVHNSRRRQVHSQ